MWKSPKRSLNKYSQINISLTFWVLGLYLSMLYIYLGKLKYFTNLNLAAIWGWFPLLTMIPVRENSEVVIIYPHIYILCRIRIWHQLNFATNTLCLSFCRFLVLLSAPKSVIDFFLWSSRVGIYLIGTDNLYISIIRKTYSPQSVPRNMPSCTYHVRPKKGKAGATAAKRNQNLEVVQQTRDETEQSWFWCG